MSVAPDVKAREKTIVETWWRVIKIDNVKVPARQKSTMVKYPGS